jgi:hypothetical protein
MVLPYPATACSAFANRSRSRDVIGGGKTAPTADKRPVRFQRAVSNRCLRPAGVLYAIRGRGRRLSGSGPMEPGVPKRE